MLRRNVFQLIVFDSLSIHPHDKKQLTQTVIPHDAEQRRNFIHFHTWMGRRALI